MTVSFKSWTLPLLFLAGLAVLALCLSGRHRPQSGPPGPGKAPAIRMVSLSPSVTEMVYALGCGDCLVGRSSSCDFPAAARSLPSVGGFGHPSLEKIAALQPRYVVAVQTKDRTFQESLAKLGIRYVELPSRRLDDYDACIRQLGQLLECPDRAEAEIARFHRELAPFRRQAEAMPEASRPKVYLEVWNRPLKTCGRDSFVDDLIACAGGVNVGRTVAQDYWSCSDEWVLVANPAVVICPAMGSGTAGEVAARPGWAAVDAVKSGRIHTGIEQSLIYRLGPRTPLGVAELHRLINGTPEGKAR